MSIRMQKGLRLPVVQITGLALIVEQLTIDMVQNCALLVTTIIASPRAHSYRKHS